MNRTNSSWIVFLSICMSAMACAVPLENTSSTALPLLAESSWENAPYGCAADRVGYAIADGQPELLVGLDVFGQVVCVENFAAIEVALPPSDAERLWQAYMNGLAEIGRHCLQAETCAEGDGDPNPQPLRVRAGVARGDGDPNPQPLAGIDALGDGDPNPQPLREPEGMAKDGDPNPQPLDSGMIATIGDGDPNPQPLRALSPRWLEEPGDPE